MKKILTFSFILLTVTFLTSCNRNIRPAKAPGVPSYHVVGIGDSSIVTRPGGIIYALPKSRLDVTIVMKRTELVKGPFAAWAGKYLGIENVINANSTSWQISDITIRPVPVPDTAHLYYVALGAVDTSSIPFSMMINLNNRGFLTGVMKSEDALSVEYSSINQGKAGFSSVFKYFAENNLFETVDTVVEKVSIDSVIVEKKVLRTKMVEKPVEQRAKEAADFIQKLKDQRISLLTGYQAVPYDQAAIRYMAEEIEKMEIDYIELFTGISVETTHKKTVTFIPELNNDCIPLPVARFSTQEGIMPLESNKGEMIYVQVCSRGVAEAASRLTNSLQVGKQEKNTGFVYRIPEYSMVTVWLGAKQQKEFSMLIPQFGTTARLPWFVTRFVLDPETGAISRIIYP
jgi:hypothetical protein